MQKGFNPIAHVEMNQYAATTLETRSIHYYLKKVRRLNIYYDYLRGDITQTDLLEVVPAEVLQTVICEEMSNFPEYLECYKDFDSMSGLMVLQRAPLPQDIIKLGAGGINEIWRNAKVRAAGIKRATTLVKAAQSSVGLEGWEAARLEIWILVNDYISKQEQMNRLDEYLKEKVMEVPNVEKLLAIKGVGLGTGIGFVAEVGRLDEGI